LGQLRKQNVLGFFLLEEGAHDETTFNQLKTFSNGAIMFDQSRKTLQLEGFPGSPSTPIHYEIASGSVGLKKDGSVNLGEN
jgi:hypothetical protein